MKGLKEAPRKFATLLVQFEHATVVVVGVDFVLMHLASIAVVASTVVLLGIFHFFIKEI